MNAVLDSRARAVRLRLSALSGVVLVSVFALAQLVPLPLAPAPAPASAASPTTTPPTTTTSSLVPSGNSSGCLASRPPKPGTTIQYMSAGGDSGGYIQELPSRYTGRTAMPVVMDLHGYGVSAADMVKITQLGTYGNRDGFITITPQVVRPFPYWKTGSTSKDVAFLRGVITRVESTLCVDQNRLFVTGYSNGAIMASVLACVDATQIAAIAPSRVSPIPPPAIRPARCPWSPSTGPQTRWSPTQEGSARRPTSCRFLRGPGGTSASCWATTCRSRRKVPRSHRRPQPGPSETTVRRRRRPAS